MSRSVILKKTGSAPSSCTREMPKLVRYMCVVHIIIGKGREGRQSICPFACLPFDVHSALEVVMATYRLNYGHAEFFSRSDFLPDLCNRIAFLE